MTSLSRNFLLFGQSESPAEPVALRAGPVCLIFEAGDLRYIKLGEREVIRRIYAAVRDRDWGTVAGKISNLKSQIAEDRFRISYEMEHRQRDIHFVWRGEIIGESDGAIRFAFDGEAKTTFLRSRIGFCVLHPIRECAGARYRAGYANGTSAELKFPEVIAAKQPIEGLQDLAALAHEIEPGLWAELEFEGDTFETEDQRNWIDASFKTYCTPLRLPYPVEIKAGTRVQQAITFRLAGKAPPIAIRRGGVNATMDLLLGDEVAGPLPSLGLGTAGGVTDLSAKELSRLAFLKPVHLRVDVRSSTPEAREQLIMLARSCAQASDVGAAIELAVHLDDLNASTGAWLRELRNQLRKARGPLARIMVFGSKQERSTPAPALALARAELGSLGAPIGSGTDADLYQLNLERPPAEGADFICWSMNPQVHAFDNASIAETPEAAAQQVTSVRQYFPGKPLVVSPITLKPRFNPVATGPDPAVAPGDLPPPVDARQISLFGAAWTLAMLKAMADSDANSVTFYETIGWRGVLETTAGSPVPDKFPSRAGQVFPIYHVFAALAEFVGGEALRCASSSPRELAVLMAVKEDRARLCLGNLTVRALTVSLPAESRYAPRSLRRLNEHTAAKALADPEAFWSDRPAFTDSPSLTELRLGPCELVFLDWVRCS
jgi:hypothetical protein